MPGANRTVSENRREKKKKHHHFKKGIDAVAALSSTMNAFQNVMISTEVKIAHLDSIHFLSEIDSSSQLWRVRKRDFCNASERGR